MKSEQERTGPALSGNGPLPACPRCEESGDEYGVYYLYTEFATKQVGTLDGDDTPRLVRDPDEPDTHFIECTNGHAFTITDDDV